MAWKELGAQKAGASSSRLRSSKPTPSRTSGRRVKPSGVRVNQRSRMGSGMERSDQDEYWAARARAMARGLTSMPCTRRRAASMRLDSRAISATE